MDRMAMECIAIKEYQIAAELKSIDIDHERVMKVFEVSARLSR